MTHSLLDKTCIVFDFDCTVTYRHMYFFLNDVDNFNKMYEVPGMNKDQIRALSNAIRSIYIKNKKFVSHDKLIQDKLSLPSDSILNKFIDIIFGGFERVDILNKFLKRYHENGIDLHISSRGHLREIILALRITGLFDYFTTIHSTLDKLIYQKNGSRIVQYDQAKDKLIMYMLKHQYDNVFYIDDTHLEHERLKSDLANYCSCTGYEQCALLVDIDIKNYIFINTLTKNGSGIGGLEISLFDEIMMSMNITKN